MKKIIVTGATILMALFIAAPSFAIETKVTGTFTLDGVLDYNPSLTSDKDAKETISYREMQLRINTESKITDKITFYTRFDILDKLLSSKETNSVVATGEDDDNIQFDRAWMQIISPVGVFRLGRKEGIKWGTDFFDDGNAYGTDRAEWIIPINVGEDKFVIGMVGEKALETTRQNEDNEKFYVTGTYVAKDFKTGLLIGYYNYKSFKEENGADDLSSSYTDLLAAGANQLTAGTTYQTSALTYGLADIRTQNAYFNYNSTVSATNEAKGIFGSAAQNYLPKASGAITYIAPYFSGKLGPLSINAEFDYVTGEAQFEDVKTTEMVFAVASQHPLFNPLNPTPAGSPAAFTYAADYIDQAYGNKKDVTMMAYLLQVGYDISQSTIQLGYAFMSGDKDGGLNDLEASAMLAPSEDWEKVFILTSNDHGMSSTLGGDGNILNIGSDMNSSGMNLMYADYSFNVNDSLSIGGLFAYATADEAPDGYEDDYGMEVDLRLHATFMENLQYNVVAGYLMSGDFWKKGGTDKVDDVFAFYHEIVLSF
ncbi:MAG: hypothetical protein WC799_03660 [Desulfobacteraceae bacterium]|jgi:hypothetical protein